MKNIKWFSWDYAVMIALSIAIYLIALVPTEFSLIHLSLFWMVPTLVLLLLNRYVESNPPAPKPEKPLRPKVRQIRY